MIAPIPVFQSNIPISIVIKQEQPKPKEYLVVSGDTLTSISEAQGTTVARLWAKNTELTSPDLITSGTVLKVPLNTDILTDRPMPVSIEVPSAYTSQPLSGGFSSSGNTYFVGQCVWYIKNIVPWVQNGWGNASSWKYTSGHPVSPVPAVGTIAWTKAYGHVSIVRAIGDGTITVEEMNYYGEGKTDTRVAPISEFEYIYP